LRLPVSTEGVNKCLVDALGLTHGGLDVSRLEVLPVLLQQGHQEVDGQVDVLTKVFLVHLDVTDAGTQAQHLLELELDGGLGLEDLVSQRLGHADGKGELTGTVHVGADNTGDGLDDRLRGQEGIRGAAHLLHKLLVLVQLLKVFHVHGRKVRLLGNIFVGQIANDGHSHARAAVNRQTQGTSEALVLVGVVVLQVDLEINRLNELSLLALGQDGGDGLSENLGWDLGHGGG